MLSPFIRSQQDCASTNLSQLDDVSRLKSTLSLKIEGAMTTSNNSIRGDICCTCSKFKQQLMCLKMIFFSSSFFIFFYLFFFFVFFF